MENWKNTKCGKCVIQRKSKICNRCIGYCYFRPMSNADRIRSMSDEELADYLYRMALCSLITLKIDNKEIAIPKLLKWLQSEAE